MSRTHALTSEQLRAIAGGCEGAARLDPDTVRELVRGYREAERLRAAIETHKQSHDRFYLGSRHDETLWEVIDD